MQTEPAFTETELARRWNVSIKTLQRWRSEERGPPYIKLSKAVRYPVDEIVTYEQAIRQGMSNEAPLPALRRNLGSAKPSDARCLGQCRCTAKCLKR